MREFVHGLLLCGHCAMLLCISCTGCGRAPARHVALLQDAWLLSSRKTYGTSCLSASHRREPWSGRGLQCCGRGSGPGRLLLGLVIIPLVFCRSSSSSAGAHRTKSRARRRRRPRPRTMSRGHGHVCDGLGAALLVVVRLLRELFVLHHHAVRLVVLHLHALGFVRAGAGARAACRRLRIQKP